MASGDIFIRPSWLHVDVTVMGDDPTRPTGVYSLLVDQYGLVEIERYPGKLQHDNRTTHPNFEADRAAWKFAIEELMESELVRWQAIGPEDHELFITDEFHKALKPSLDGIGGERQKWHIQSPYAESQVVDS